MDFFASNLVAVHPMQDASVLTVSSVIRRLLKPRKTSQVEPAYTLAEVSVHCHCNDCWVVVEDIVYDVTSFLHSHPGGLEVLLEQAGRDATVAFYGSGHDTTRTKELLERLRIGVLVQHEKMNIFAKCSMRSTIR